MTQTITCTTQSTEVLTISLHLEPIQKKVAALIKKLETTKVLEPYKKKIDAWVLKYLPGYFIDISTEEKKEKASLALCFLLSDVIHDAAIRTNDSDLLDFEDELRNILDLTLPKGEQLDQFIEGYEKFNSEYTDYEKKLQLIEAGYHEQIKQIYDSANQINKKIVDLFQSFKKELLQINENRKILTEEMNAKIDNLTEKVTAIHQQLSTVAMDVQQVGKNMQTEQNSLQKIISQGIEILRQVGK